MKTLGLADLPPRQREVALGVRDGLTYRQIGNRLGISPRTAENHVHAIAAKLGRSDEIGPLRCVHAWAVLNCGLGDFTLMLARKIA